MALPLLALIPALAGYILTDWLHIPDTRRLNHPPVGGVIHPKHISRVQTPA